MESFLVTDFGVANARTLLVDVVEGQYRLVATAITRTTALPPEGDVVFSLVRNIEQIEQQTGRMMLDTEGQYETGLIQPSLPDGRGFDKLLATASSAGRPMKAVVVALMDDVSLVSAQRALSGTYVEIVETVTMTEFATEEARINQIMRHRPDVIFMTGGTDGGNTEAVRELVLLVELAVKLVPSESRPLLLFAGNADLAKWVEGLFEEHSVIFIADNIRPSNDVENLDPAKLKLIQVFDDFMKRQPGGFGFISEMCAGGIVPTVQSVGRLVRYLDTLNDHATLYVDVGGGTSTIIGSFEGDSFSNIRSNLGLGRHILEVLEVVDWRNIERWLPFDVRLDELEAWVYNKWLAPLTVPQTLRDLLIELAIAREIVRLLVDDLLSYYPPSMLNKLGTVIVSGAVFTYGLNPRLSALVVAESLQAQGICEIWLDPDSLAAALGAMSLYEPAATVQVVDNDGFLRLATTFAPTGNLATTRIGNMKVTLTLPDDSVLEANLSNGDVWMPTLPAGIWVDVDIRLSRGLRMNGQRKISERYLTGVGGFVFDMRGRPFNMPAGRRRKAALAEWFTMATGIEIDDEMLTEDTTEADALVAAGGGALTEGDFPDYDALPDTDLAKDFDSLFADDEDDFDLDDLEPEDDDFDDGLSDLRRELGVR